MNVKKKLKAITITWIIFSFLVLPVNAVTYEPPYSDKADGPQRTGEICPIYYGDANKGTGKCRAWAYTGGPYDISTWGKVWELYTPATTSTFQISVNYNYRYECVATSEDAEAWFRMV